MDKHRHIRRALLFGGTIIGAVALAATGVAGAAVPGGTTAVAVTAGATTSGKNADLAQAASISGTITSVAGTSTTNKLQALVQVFLGGKPAGVSFSDATGHYLVGGLRASTTGYAVCVNGRLAFGGPITSGYLGRCFATAAWSGGKPAAGATLLPLTAGEQKTGIDIALPSGAAITGTVTSPSGSGIADALVTAKNGNTGATYVAITDSTGHYSVTSLPLASKGYQVCFDGRMVKSGTGFLRGCYNGAVSVTAGHTHTGVNGRLARAGAIAGTVLDASNGKPVSADTVTVFSSTGTVLGADETDANGHYVVRGLSAATGDRVCAAPISPNPAVHYHGKCWKTTAYNGGRLPSGTAPVSVKLGQTHGSIDLKLGKTVLTLGSIAGTITAASGAAPVANATVTVFTSGGARAGSTRTDAAGHYKVNYLKASSTGYVVCATAGSATAPPATGWAPRCFSDAEWSGIGVPATATRIPLSAGQNRTGKDFALPDGGAISGTVTGAAGSMPVSADVLVFNATGKKVASATTDFFSGAYTVTGLNTGNYTVCFQPQQSFGQPGWLPECYDNVAWDGTA